MTKCAPYFAEAPYTYLRCGTPLSISFRPAHPHPAVERGMTKCAPYFAEAPRTAKSLGRFTVQTAEVEEVSWGCCPIWGPFSLFMRLGKRLRWRR